MKWVHMNTAAAAREARRLRALRSQGACSRLAAAAVITVLAAGCETTTTYAQAPASSSAASSPAASSAGSAPATAASATDVQVCNDVNAWEASNDGMAASTFGTDSASEAIVQEAAGSSAVDQDVRSLSTDSGSQASGDLPSLAADCAAAGVTLTGSDFVSAASSPSAAPPPTTPAAPTTLLAQSGSGSYTSSRFTVGGTGDYQVYWAYNEGSFGQSVNFQLWEDGGSDLNFTDPNQLGTQGSGVVNVYNDAGTHTLTVNSEGSWTVKVVTAP